MSNTEQDQHPKDSATAGSTDDEPVRQGELLDEDSDVGAESEGLVSDEAAEVPEGEEGDRIAELEKALEEAEARAQENWEHYVRARAEMENAQRRAQKDVQQAKRQGIEKIAGDLLQVRDSLEMGVSAANQEDADLNKVREGSELTLKMLEQVMERHEIEEVNPEGERFNPEYHEAMAMQPSTEQEPNTVLQVVQKGFLLQGKLLRPAMVMVAKKPDESPGGQVDEQA